MSIIQGRFCCFDDSDYQIDETRANSLVKYFDKKYPQVMKLLGVNNYPEKIYIFTRKENCAAQKYDNDKIKFTPNFANSNCITRGNKGFLIHEAAHIAQNYTLDTYGNNYWIAEAIADYARIKLDWDNSDIPNEYPCNNRHSSFGKCSKCDAAFLIWLEQKYLDNNFIAVLNKELQNGQNGQVFIEKRFKASINNMYQGYRINSNAN